jgi:hypothetical protein
MALITTGGISALLGPSYRKVYIETGKERPLEYVLVANVSEMPFNPASDQQMTGLSTMPAKPQGRAFALDDIKTGGSKTYTATAFGLAVEVTFEAWRDELYGVLEEMVKGLARAARNRQEVQFWAIFNDAFTGSTYTGFNSVALCSTSQTAITGGGAAAGANRPSPDIGFSVTGIQNSITRFEGMTDERGMPRLMSPTMALIHYSNKFVAREILGSGGKPYTAHNEINALIEEDLSWMVGHYITTSTNWWMLAPKGIHDLNFMWRDYEIFDMFDDPLTKTAIACNYMRFAEGFGSWRGIDGSTG